jgi:hypothetical protein
LKTGFGKYVGVDAEGFLIAIAEAIGARERFDVVFQDVTFKFFTKKFTIKFLHPFRANAQFNLPLAGCS